MQFKLGYQTVIKRLWQFWGISSRRRRCVGWKGQGNMRLVVL